MAMRIVFAAAAAFTLVAADDAAPPAGSDGYPSVMLLGGTAFIMILFYMANAHVDEVKGHTWSMLSSAVSIFCAVMFNTVVNEIVERMIGVDSAASPPTGWNIASSAIQMACYWLVAAGILFSFRASILRLKGYGTIAGHIMGFASIGLWTRVCDLDPFRTNAWWIVPVVLLIFLVFSTIFAGFFFIFGKLVGKSAHLSQADQDRWHDQSKDTGTDFFCLGCAFVFTTWIKFLIFGQLDPALSDPKSTHEAKDMWLLGIVSLACLALGAVFTVVGHLIQNSSIWDILTTVSSTIASMCLVDVFNWRILPTAPSEQIGKLSIAFQLSIIAIITILVIAILSRLCGLYKRALRGAFTGLALAVGSSWEKTFDASVDGLDAFGYTEARKSLITLLLVAVVFPAWMVYILPKGDDDLKNTIKKSPPVWAICCDCDPCEDEEEFDEENEFDEE